MRILGWMDPGRNGKPDSSMTPTLRRYSEFEISLVCAALFRASKAHSEQLYRRYWTNGCCRVRCRSYKALSQACLVYLVPPVCWLPPSRWVPHSSSQAPAVWILSSARLRKPSVSRSLTQNIRIFGKVSRTCSSLPSGKATPVSLRRDPLRGLHLPRRYTRATTTGSAKSDRSTSPVRNGSRYRRWPSNKPSLSLPLPLDHLAPRDLTCRQSTCRCDLITCDQSNVQPEDVRCKQVLQEARSSIQDGGQSERKKWRCASQSGTEHKPSTQRLDLLAENQATDSICHMTRNRA